MNPNERDKSPLTDIGRRIEAELGMVRVLEEFARPPQGYVLHIIDPREFPAGEEDIPVALGIARRGAIARVTTREELDQCVIVRPTINTDGKFGIIVESSPQQKVPLELGACIEGIGRAVSSLQDAMEMFS